MKYVITVSTLFIDGVKHRRGDVVELTDTKQYGHRIQPIYEPAKEQSEEKPKRRRRTKAEMELARGLQNEEV